MVGTVIEASGIKLYKSRHKILDVSNFSLKKGEVMALIGPNGAGKSSLLQVLALLQRPTAGNLSICGVAVDSKNKLDLRRRMAVAFQEPLLLDTTVYKNVAAGLLIRGFRKDQVKGRVREWLEKFGISSLAHRSARFLSGGESQRVNLARAFALDPEVLFLDEPFSALDYPTRRSLIADLGQILKTTGVSTVFVTHDHNEIPPLAGMVSVMQEGRIVQCCSPQELFSNPVNETVAALVGI